MKTYRVVKKFCFVLLAVITLYSCEEDTHGPLVKDKDSPTALNQSDIKVINLPGGAIIEYAVPADEDALLIEATYERNGTMVKTKSSIFKNTLKIEGLREASGQKVDIVVVDRSDNRSEAVSVDIKPLPAPIDELFKTLDLVRDFGGVKLNYENKDNLEVEFLLYTIDENGNRSYSQSAFVNTDALNSHTFRPFPPQNQKFGIEIVDRWDNITKMVDYELTPIEEVFLDVFDFKALSLEGDANDAFGWVLSNIFDGNLDSGFHTSQGEPGTVVAPYTEPYHMFTIDLGAEVKLSRMKWWMRQGSWAYAHGNPRYFEVWGIDKLPEDNGASFDGWTKLIENGEVIKPSGQPTGVNSADDEQRATLGDEFDIPVEAPPVRYIRFVNLENWSGTKFIHLMDVNFWGQPN